MPGLFAYEDQLKKINAHQPPLNKLDQVIEWEMFRKPIEEALYVEPKAPGGRPYYDRLMMFKILSSFHISRHGMHTDVQTTRILSTLISPSLPS